jgi:hypothetical protein
MVAAGRTVHGERRVGVPQWSRIFVLLTGIVAWLAIVAVSLWLKQIPSAVIVGFPAGLWIALKGQSTIAARRTNDDEPAAEPAATDREADPT